MRPGADPSSAASRSMSSSIATMRVGSPIRSAPTVAASALSRAMTATRYPVGLLVVSCAVFVLGRGRARASTIPNRVARTRLDQTLADRGLVVSLVQARREILAGNVLVDERPGIRGPFKPSDGVGAEQVVRLREARRRFVSRGGLKLEAALDHFQVDPAGRVAIDLGASTGGFTDCLLQRGASRVYAVDVGTNQLAWSLRQDPRVVSLERTDARAVRLDEPVSLVVGDLSYISLALILPVVARLLQEPAHPADHPAPDGAAPAAVLLIKPQFEAPARHVEPGGRVSDPSHRQAAIDSILAAAADAGLTVAGIMDSPVPGARAGNIEALVHLLP